MSKIDDARALWTEIGQKTADSSIMPADIDNAAQAILDALEGAVDMYDAGSTDWNFVAKALGGFTFTDTPTSSNRATGLPVPAAGTTIPYKGIRIGINQLNFFDFGTWILISDKTYIVKNYVATEIGSGSSGVVIHDTTLLGDGTSANPLSVSMLELPMQTVVNGAIILENPFYVYKINTALALSVTVDTTHIDLNQYVKFYLSINLNDYVALTFPSNWFFANLDVPNMIGQYMYEVSTNDAGVTWHLQTKYKNIASVGLDQSGNEIIGAVIRYVDGDLGLDTNDGLTWATAYKNIQPAIDISNDGDAVFVKGKIGGLIYYPTTYRTTGTATTKSIIIKKGVNVYGGFVGIETSLYQRPMVTYQKILKLPSGDQVLNVNIPQYDSIISGDLNGDGSSIVSCLIYSTILGSVTLNGFTLDKVTSVNATPTLLTTGVNVSNCYISNMTNTYNDSHAFISGGNYSNSIFNDLSETTSNGWKDKLFSVVSLTNCIVENVTAGGSAGGSNLSSPITNCYFGNITSGRPITNIATNSFFYNCITSFTFIFNSAQLINCGIRNSSNLNSVGYIAYNCIGSSVSFLNNTSNYAIVGGSTSTLISCFISNNNTALGYTCYLGTLINCTVILNIGAGTYNCNLENSIVWKNVNVGLAIANAINTNSSVEQYCAFENETRSGVGNISISANNTGDTQSPYFTYIQIAGTYDDTVNQPSNCSVTNLLSPLINAGLTSLNSSGYGSVYDLLSLPRVEGTSIDIGATEFKQ